MLEGAFVALPPEVQAADLGAWRDLPGRLPQEGTPSGDAAAPPPHADAGVLVRRLPRADSSRARSIATVTPGLSGPITGQLRRSPRSEFGERVIHHTSWAQCFGHVSEAVTLPGLP
jgi:hypothetical protein